jgi:hypothetical protein
MNESRTRVALDGLLAGLSPGVQRVLIRGVHRHQTLNSARVAHKFRFLETKHVSEYRRNAAATLPIG